VPEMPEIQAHAERMAASLVGRPLESFELLNFATLKTFDPPADGAVGYPLRGIRRRGKYLIFDFGNDTSHVVHLMQGGRLRPDPKRTKKPRQGLARWVFAGSDGTGEDASVADEAWLLTEAGSERKAGVWAVSTPHLSDNENPHNPLGHLGPEAHDLDQATLGALLSSHSRRIHGVLRDQRVLAGLGRLLTNEILYEAALSPFANAAKLSPDEIGQLHLAIGEVVERATVHERTLTDIGKSADRPSKVHNREGEPCVDCAESIRSVTYRAYTVYYCPQRQTNGKRLADNTTSRFLK